MKCGKKLKNSKEAMLKMGIFSRKPNIEKLKAKRDVEGLISALNYRRDHDVRIEAAIALGEIRDERAVEPLFRLI